GPIDLIGETRTLLDPSPVRHEDERLRRCAGAAGAHRRDRAGRDERVVRLRLVASPEARDAELGEHAYDTELHRRAVRERIDRRSGTGVQRVREVATDHRLAWSGCRTRDSRRAGDTTE